MEETTSIVRSGMKKHGQEVRTGSHNLGEKIMHIQS
jgi:hypothetical protein